MADGLVQSQPNEKTPSSSSPIDEPGPKTISVNVDLSGDRWVVVSYQDEKGDLFHGILMKAGDSNSAERSGSQDAVKDSSFFPNAESWKKASEVGSAPWISSPGFPQSMLLNGFARSPEWDPNKLSAVALRRTCSNGATKKEDEFSLANLKPALGIRRLENRSVRLRPTATQRSTVLCAKCQEQRVWLPPSRRTVTNGAVDRIRNGPVSLVSNNSPTSNSTLPSSNKRRFSDAVDPSTSLPSANSHNNAKKFKSRNGTSMAAAEADQSTAAALPSASKVIPSSDSEGASKNNSAPDAATAEKKVLLKVPKLKISFGNNEGKTTTIITLPPTETATGSGTSHEVDKGGNKSSGTLEKSQPAATVSSAGGDSFDEREGVMLPGGLRVGDVVWAKMPGSPYWPSKIFSASGNAACVTWCGSRQYGFVEFKAMEPFKETFRKRYNIKRNTGGYQKAVAEAIVKCSGDDASSAEIYYYQHLISAVCWKYLTGSKNAAAAKSRTPDRSRRRNSGRSSSTASSRHGKSSKPSKHSSFHAFDGLDSESVTSVSSLNSPASNSTTPTITDWQPRVVIRVLDQEVAEKGRPKLQLGGTWKKLVNEVKPTLVADEPKPAESVQFYVENGPVSPLPVQRSEDDDEDDDDDFKKLEIDETAQLEDEEDVDGERDQSPSSSTTLTTSESPTDGAATYRLVSAPPAPDKTSRHQGQGAEANGQVPGVRARVGEGQDDFESALTELQEMNELCAGTSVLAQC